MADEKQLSIRLSLIDGGKVKAELVGLGTEGKAALDKLATAGNASSGLQVLSAAAKDVGTEISAMAGRVPVLGSALSALGSVGVGVAASIAGVSAAIIAGTKAAAEEELRLKRLEASIAATGRQAGLSGTEIAAMAKRLEDSTLATKDAALEAAQALATFGGIGRKNFELVLQAAQDLTASGFGDLRSNAVALGKFFQDPVQGATALNRAVAFLTPELKRTIEELDRTGQRGKAAEAGLEALRRRVGGAGSAEADTAIGATKQLAKEWSNLLQTLEQVTRYRSVVDWIGKGLLRPPGAGLIGSGDGADASSTADMERRLAELRARAGARSGLGQSGEDAAIRRLEDQIRQQQLNEAELRRRTGQARGNDTARGAAAERNALLGQAGELSRSLDPVAEKTKELRQQQELLNRAIKESGDPTGEYAAALSRVSFQLRALEDPVAKQLRLMKEETQALSLSGAERARLEGLQRAEQAARERGLPLSAKEVQDAQDLAEAKYREARAREIAKQASEAAAQQAQREEEARRQAQERGQKIIEGHAAIGEAYKREAKDNEYLIEGLRQGNTEYEKRKALLEILARYRENGTPLTSPEELANAQRQAEALGKQRETIDDLTQKYRDQKAAARDAANAIGTAFEDAVVKGQGARAAAQGLLEDLGRIALRLSVTKPLEAWGTKMMDGFDFTNVTSWLGSLFHSGKRAGDTGGMTRAVDPSWFVAAPRFHSGRNPVTPYLRPDEIPAVIRRDEEVLTPDDPRHVYNQRRAANDAGRAAAASGGLSMTFHNSVTVKSGGGAGSGAGRTDGQKIGADVVRVLEDRWRQILREEMRPGGLLRQGGA